MLDADLAELYGVAAKVLMTSPDPPKRSIGLVTHEDRGKKGQARGS